MCSKRLNRWLSSNLNMERPHTEGMLHSMHGVINMYAKKDYFLRVKNPFVPRVGEVLIDGVNLKGSR